MKRSEMIKLIARHISYARFVNANNFDELHADHLLHEMEQAGMLPPGHMKPIPYASDGKQYPLIPGDFQNEKDVWCTPGVNEWEPEE